MYVVDLDDPAHDNLCLTTNKEDLAWLWHFKLGHDSYNVLHKLVKYNIVRGLPKILFKKNNKFCESCT